MHMTQKSQDELKAVIRGFMESRGIEQLRFDFSATKDEDAGGNPFLAVDLDVDLCICEGEPGNYGADGSGGW